MFRTFIFYVDVETDESTNSRRLAMSWYRSGHAVECWQNGEMTKVMYAD